MIHIVFQEADVAVLQKAIELDSTLTGPVVLIRDDYAVGPLEHIYQPEGWQLRKAWWQELLQYSPYTDMQDMVDDRLTVHRLLQYLDGQSTAWDESVQLPEEPSPAAQPAPKKSGKQPPVPVAPLRELWIWMGQNPHDVCGYYWLMSQLKAHQGKVQVLYLNNLPFINEKGGIFYPSSLYEIQPKEFLKARKLARTITPSEFELDPDEWKKLCAENEMVRILEGGKKIVSRKADFYDKELLQAVGKEAGKLSKILSNALGKMKISTGDVFLVWRIRQLAQQGVLDLSGDWNKGWKEMVVKPAGLSDAVAEQQAVSPNHS